ncbi:MAG: hypothetical protein E7487_06465 [Ruminococcaceae bacterium]|nr:hypothetical protein [Oscillospiraceae bacterium]
MPTECIWSKKDKNGLSIAAFSGIGDRETQQDAFGFSDEKWGGFAAVLCDGMGGMLSGGKIAEEVVRRTIELCEKSGFAEDIQSGIEEINADVYAQYDGTGGTTLVVVRIEGDRMKFWSIGDSDIWLVREGRAWLMNRHHNCLNEFCKLVLNGRITYQDAVKTANKNAVTQYIGDRSIRPDKIKRDFRIKRGDVILLSSDGVSGTLTAYGIARAAAKSPHECCKELEYEILSARRPDQDNYSAVVIRYDGREEC